MAAVGVPAQGVPAIGVKPGVAVKLEAVAGNHASSSGGSAPASKAEEVTDREIVAMEHAIGKLEGLKTHLAGEVCAKATVDALGDIVDEMCIDVCVEVHRWHRLGMLVFDSTDAKNAANRVVDVAGYDVHGQVPEKVPKNENFLCDHCGTKVGASKYAAHLAKCMGHGGRRMRNRDAPDVPGGVFGAVVSGSPSMARPSPTNHVAAVSPVGVDLSLASPKVNLESTRLNFGGDLGKRTVRDDDYH